MQDLEAAPDILVRAAVAVIVNAVKGQVLGDGEASADPLDTRVGQADLGAGAFAFLRAVHAAKAGVAVLLGAGVFVVATGACPGHAAVPGLVRQVRVKQAGNPAPDYSNSQH